MGGFGPHLVLLCLSGALTALFVLGYSAMGFGLQVLEKSHDFHEEGAALLQTVVVLLLLLYVADVHRWPTILQGMFSLAAFALLCTALMLLVTETPFGPLCVYTILMPLFLIGIKFVCYKNVPAAQYTMVIYRVCVLEGLVLTALFFAWAFQSANMWNAETRAHYSSQANCAVNYEDLEECRTTTHPHHPDLPCFWKDVHETIIDFEAGGELCTFHCLDVYEECQEAFIMWAFPGLTALGLIVTGLIAKYLKPDQDPSFSGVTMVIKFMAIFLFLIWVFASMAGAGEGLSNNLIAFAIAMCIGSSLIVGALFWNHVQKTEKGIEEAIQTAQTYKNILRGLLLLVALPLILLYLALSVVNQLVRRFILVACCGGCVKYSDEEREHRGCFTKTVSDQIEDFKNWDHAKALTYTVYWGYGYVFFNALAAKFTTLFLSWLIEYTKSMSILAVTGIVTCVGMILFLLPPIPGIPIYLTAGIVIVSVGEESMGLWGSIAYSCFVAQMIKLLGCAVQQKCIGELFGKSVAIRRAVGVNSDGIRAMRVILSDPRFTMQKVYVLVGGPDWPVSVLCGILNLPLFPILMGTQPVIALVLPSALAGSFAYMGSIVDENGLAKYSWADTMAAVASACIAASIFTFMMLAAGAVKETFDKRRDEIDAIPIDEEVQKADDMAAKKEEAYSEAVAWANVPIWAKLSLISAVGCMISCFFILSRFSEQCFAEYDLMYTIDEHLDGQWHNLVLPLGWYALLLTGIATVFLVIFKSWAGRATSEIMESGEINPLQEDTPEQPLPEQPLPEHPLPEQPIFA